MQNQPTNIAERVFRAAEEGMRMRAALETQRALAALQAGPNPDAMRALYTYNPALAMQVEDQMYQRAERGRAATSRDAMADALLGGPPPMMAPAFPPNVVMPDVPQRDPLAPLPERPVANPAPQGSPADSGEGLPEMPVQRQSPSRPRYSDAEQRAIRADPDAFLTFQGKRLDLTKKQFGQYRDLNNMGMQLLGGVHDQATYEAAKQRALQLYSSFGHDASEFIGGLPPQYSPETIKMLRLQGMDTAKQLAAIARENNIESQIEVREQRADEYERHNRAIESNVRRGQDRRPSGRGTKAPTPTAVIGRIMDKQARGERLSGAERQVLEEYRAGKGGKRSGGDLIGQVYQRGGKRIQYSKKAGGYVDLATGQRVN